MKEPTYLSKTFATLIVCVAHYQEQYMEPVPLEIWQAFHMVAARLHRVQDPKTYRFINEDDLTLSCTKQPPGWPFPLTPDAPFSQSLASETLEWNIDDLPTEIVSHIFGYLVDSQRDMCNILKTSRFWHAIAEPLLYRSPCLSSRKGIQQLLSVGRSGLQSKWPLKRKLDYLQFAPCASGSLMGTDTVVGVKGILSSHSCLYRCIVSDRHRYQDIHPLFFQLASTFANLKIIKESFKKDFQKDPVFHTVNQSNTRKTGFTISDYLLTRLLRNARRILETQEWKGVSPLMSQETCLFLLDMFQSDSHMIGSLAVGCLRKARPGVISQCRHMLNIISGALLIQVQYVTLCSQRLLDAYCLIYYEGLDVCGSLDVDNLEKVLNSFNRAQLSYPYAGEAKAIHDCLMLLYAKSCSEIPEDCDKSDCISSPSKELDLLKLRSSLASFPPSGANKEVCEFFEGTLEKTLWTNVLWRDQDLDELSRWKEWLEMIVKWQRASQQMEPVKELLRTNMAKIDGLRGSQVIIITLGKMGILINL